MKNTKHIALRTCIGTGEKKDKREMIRLVKLSDSTVVIDLKGKEKGRGANISSNIEAFDFALKKKAIERALKLNKKLNEQEVVILRQSFIDAINNKQLRQGSNKISLKISKEDFNKIKDKVS